MILATIGQPRRRCKAIDMLWAAALCDGCRRTFLIKRGVAHALKKSRHFCAPSCANKQQRTGAVLDRVKRSTFLEKYGVDSPAKDRDVLARMRATNMARHGGWPQQNSDIAAKRVATCIERYGVAHACCLPSTKANANSVAACQKRHETMKRNGTYGRSRHEDAFYGALCERFGVDDVTRQVKIDGTRWAIDFYVKSIDTYVQFDGAYWHGLDRPSDMIVRSSSPRDVAILRKPETDRMQDSWFATRGMRLVRVKDDDYRMLGAEALEVLK